MNKLRPNMPELPDRMKRLPVDERGYPVPWFVQWFHEDSTPSLLSGAPGDHPDFRVVDSRKVYKALNHKVCWVCGEKLGANLAFTIGPMCAVNRISSEPPSHRDCSIFSARACPFLSVPKMVRRENDLPAEKVDPPGIAILRNPGVTLVWITRSFTLVKAKSSGARDFLVRIGEPLETLWYCQGRPATRSECLDSIEGGLPELLKAAQAEGPGHVKQIHYSVAEVITTLVPKEAA